MHLPRILYITSCWPAGRVYGGLLRSLHIARALAKIGEVSLLVAGADDVDASVRKEAHTLFPLVGEIATESVEGSIARKWLREFFDVNFVNVSGLVVTKRGERMLLAMQDQFDLLWFSRLRTANLFRKARWERSVVDVDDLPSAVESSTGQKSNSLRRRCISAVRVEILKRHEARLRDRFTAIAVCSESDRTRLCAVARTRDAVHVIPNGFEAPAVLPLRRISTPPRIGFIGLFEYAPNLDGIRWFVRECLPLIRREVPDVRLRLVGSGTDGALRPDDPSVDGLGFVEDPSDEISTWALMVVPILTGGGTRIKIAEAFGRGCPVVSTTYGAYGYEVVDGRELRLAQTADQCAAACVWVIREPAAAALMARRAHELFLTRWSWDAITPRVHAAASAVLSGRAADDSHL